MFKGQNPAINAYEIMKDKGYQPEEIEAFLVFLKRQQRPMWLLLYLNAILILVAPGALQDFVKYLFGT